ncbi:prepilin peptidase [Asanoa iriomotensis]|uniref:prepilin peptidase n=1 Tax=Asanoa iriomotensis TaxID=234613 RepID=UPI001EF28F19|nr:A24 family peptidase [Asanoa iriomotensis]
MALVVAAAVGGGCWGAVVPGLVSRYAVAWPEGEPQPPAWRRVCQHCGKDRPHWWLASGRCPGCGRAPAPNRWVTVPVTAALCAVIAAAVGPKAALPAFLLLSALAVPLAAVDLLVLRLPDPLVGALAAGGLVLLGGAALIDDNGAALARAGLAAVVCGAGYLIFALVMRAQMGFGDVKLGATLGLFLGWFGWPAVVAGVVLAPVVNLPLVLALLVTRRADRRAQAPFGPAMVAAALAAVVFGAVR